MRKQKLTLLLTRDPITLFVVSKDWEEILKDIPKILPRVFSIYVS